MYVFVLRYELLYSQTSAVDDSIPIRFGKLTFNYARVAEIAQETIKRIR